MSVAAKALPKSAPCALQQARQHLEAARALGREISVDLMTQARELADLAEAVALVESVPAGVRDEARALAVLTSASAQRLQWLTTPRPTRPAHDD